MRNASKLLALVLAFVMVLGLVPTAFAGSVHTHGIEEYPEIELGVETTAAITASGETVYFRFTPAVTAEYTFASHNAHALDPQGYLYDSEMNQLAHHYDNGPIDFNFTLTYTLEAGKTYIWATNLYNQHRMGVEYIVTLTGDLPAEHNYVAEVTTPATCTEDGVLTYTCSDCGDSYTEIIPAGHDYVDGICSRCGEEWLVTGVCGEELTWTLDYAGTLTVSGTGAMYDFTRYADTQAPWSAYAADIKAVVLQEGVTTLGNFAFMGCTGLTAATLPDSLTTVGESAFRNCGELTTVEFGTGLTTVTGYAFMNCHKLTAADLGNVELIGNSAFYQCYALSELDLGERLQQVHTLAFSGCTSLTEVTLPDTVTVMGTDVFSDCTALTTVKLPKDMTDLPKCTFSYCSALTDVTLPAYLSTIGERAFTHCTSLESLELPFSVIAIGDRAFSGCTSLSDFTLPMAVGYVGYFAFNGCTSLGNMDFPPNLSYFTGGMFYGCTGLTEIIFPMDTTYVDDDTFADCVNVKKIVFTGSLPTIMGAFTGIEADAWYPADDSSWTEDSLLNYGGNLTWHAMCAEHSFGKWTPVVEATCTGTGIDERVCSACQWTEERVSEPAGHIWDDGVEDENGEMVYTCRICGASTDFVNPFTDVAEGSFFYDSVLWAVKNGITTGASETTFNPNGSCQRAQVVTFLWRAKGCPEPTAANNPFTDVKETDFFYKAVLWAEENGITNGLTADTFGPTAVCNRAQVVTFLWRAMEEPAPTSSEHPFTDVAEDQFYFDAMLWAVEKTITNGMTATTFAPTATCNRAQVVTFLFRAISNE